MPSAVENLEATSRRIDKPLDETSRRLEKLISKIELDFHFLWEYRPTSSGRFLKTLDLLKKDPTLFKPLLNHREYRALFIENLQKYDVKKNLALLFELIVENSEITDTEIGFIFESIPEPEVLFKNLYLEYETNLKGTHISLNNLDKKGFERWLGVDRETLNKPNIAVALHFIDKLHSDFSKYAANNAVALGKQVIDKLEQDHLLQVGKVKFYQSISSIKQAHADDVKNFVENSGLTPRQQQELLAYSCREGSFARYRQWFWNSEKAQTVQKLRGLTLESPNDIELRPVTMKISL